jgi:CheY-like chemotaxis protein
MRTILLIDDDAISNFLSKSMIEKSGIFDKVYVYSSATAALEFLSSCIDKDVEFPEIILLDVMMPVMDGFTFLEEFIHLESSKTSHVKVCMLTSSLDPKDRQQADAYPQVVEFISKPINQEKIKKFMTLIDN